MEEDSNEAWNFHTCQFCPYRSKSGFIMHKHQILHDLDGKQSKTHTFVCYAKAPEIMNCEFCDFSSLLKVNLTEHFRVVHEEKEANEEIEDILKCHRCEYCDFETHSVVVLTKHMSGCKTVFGGDLNKEVESVHEVNDKRYEFRTPKGVKCLKCEHDDVDYLENHINPKRPNSLECELCSYKSKSYCDLKQHMIVHSSKLKNVNAFKTTVKGQFQHEFQQHIIKPVVYSYPKTRRPKPAFNTIKNPYLNDIPIVRKHMENHSKNGLSISEIGYRVEFTGAKYQICKHCLYTTNKSDQMKSHMLLKHLDARQLITDSTSENDNWPKLVTPEGVTWFKCKQCTLITKEFKALESHILSEHATADNAELFKCSLCEFKTEKEKSLQQHILVKHVKRDRSKVVTKHVKPKTVGFKGKQCPQEMETHVLLEHVNEGTDLFKCTQCAYQTKIEYNLSVHIAAKHTKNHTNRYECKQCALKSNVECILHRHIVARHKNNNKVGNDQWYEWTTPDGVRLFKCKECDFIINEIEEMRKHAAEEMSRHAAVKL